MVVFGTGYTPGDTVNISSSDGSVDTTATANATGDILATTTAPTPFLSRPGPKMVTLSAQDFTSGAPATTVLVTATALAVTASPSSAKLTAKVTWYFSGFKPGQMIYGHYLRKKQVARASFGRDKGPCGLLKVRAHFYPGRHPRYAQYKLQIDNSRRYSKRSLPRFLVAITRTII
jgi:hypothetical protein